MVVERKSSLRLLRPILYVGVFFVIGFTVFNSNVHKASATACQTTGAGGLWSATATWAAGCNTAGTLPGTNAADTVQINSGATVTLDSTMGNRTITTLTIVSPGTTGTGLTITPGAGTSVTLTVSGTFSMSANAGTTSTWNQTVVLSADNGAGKANLTVGTLTITRPTNSVATSSSITCNGTGTITSGAVNINAGNTSGGGLATIAVNACTLNASGLITISGGSGSAAQLATLSVSSGTIGVGAGLTMAATAAQDRFTSTGIATINLTGTWGAGGTVTIFQGTNLNSTGGGTFSYATAVTTWGLIHVTGGTLTMSAANEQATGVTIDSASSGTLAMAGKTLTVNGDLLINGTLTSTTTTSVSGNYTNNGTHSGASGALTVSGASSIVSGTGTTSISGTIQITGTTGPTIGVNSNLTLNNLTLAATVPLTLTNGSSTVCGTSKTCLTVTNALTITALTGAANKTVISLGGANTSLTVSGTTAFNMPSVAFTATIAVGAGSATFTGKLTETGSTASAIASITLTSGTITFGAGINTSGTTNATPADHILDISGGAGTVNFTGTVQTNAAANTATGWTFTNTTCTSGGGTFVYTGSAAQTIVLPTGGYCNLKIMNTNASGATLAGALSAANQKGNLTVGDGSTANVLFKNGSQNIVGNGGSTTFNVTNLATFQMDGTTQTYPTGFTTYTFGATSTTIYNQTSAQTIGSVSTPGYGNLKFTPAGTVTYTTPASLLVQGALTVGNGTNILTVAANTNNTAVTLLGNLTIAAAAVWTKAASGIFLFKSGTAGQTWTDSTSAGQDMGAVQISSNTTNTTVTIQTAVKMSSLIVDTTQTFTGAFAVRILGGAATGDGVITLTAGNFMIDGTGNFGGATGWSFSNLTFGDGTGTTTTAFGAGSITVSGVQTIMPNQTLNAGSKTWNLNGGGTPAATTVPTLVQHVQTDTNSGNEVGNAFKISLPNPTLASNALIIALTYAHGAARTISITDNIGTNTYTASPTSADNGTVATKIYYALNVAAGTQRFTVTFDAPLLNFQANISEFYNVATSSAIDGSAASSAAASPTVSTGSFSPAVNGDLIYQYSVDTNSNILGFNHDVTSVTAGTNFSLISSGTYGIASQYWIQPTAGAINPTTNYTITGGPDSFNTAAIALKAASAGTAPSASGIRIVRETHIHATLATQTVSVPSSGNLMLVASTYPPNQGYTYTSVTDSNGNSYTKDAIDVATGVVYYNPVAASTSATMTMTITGSVAIPYIIYDVYGAAAAAFDTHAFAAVAQSVAQGDIANSPPITPTTSNGLVIGVEPVGTGPVSGVIGASYTFDSVFYTGQTDCSGCMNSADGYSHIYNPNTSALNFGWHITNDGTVTDGEGVALAFKGGTLSPLIVASGGTFTASTSTINFGTITATNIPALTYNNVAMVPASGSPTYTAAGAITTNGYFQNGDGSHAVTFVAPSGNLSVATNFTNNSTFTANGGTVVFTGATNHTIAGATTFHHMTDTTAGSTLTFTAGQIFTWNTSGVLTLTGGAGMTVTSTTTAVWLAHFTTAQSGTMTNVTFLHSGCDTGTAAVTLAASDTNDPTATINDTSCWQFPASGIIVSGTSNCSCSSTVRVAVNGSLSGVTTTVSSGTWSLSSVAVTSGQIIVVWLDGVADAAESTAVAKYDGTGDMTGIILNTNVLSVGSVDNQSLTLTNLDTYDCAADEDVMFRVNANVLEVEGLTTCAGSVSNSYTNETLQIESGDTLTVGGSESVTTVDATINGTLSGTGNVTVSGGDVINDGVITMTGGTFLVDGAGNFGGNSGTAWTFQNLTFGDGSGATTTTATGSCAITVNGIMTIAAAQILDAGSKTWTIAGSGTAGGAWARRASATLTSAFANPGASKNMGNLGATPSANDRVIAVINVSYVTSQPTITGVTDSTGTTWYKDGSMQFQDTTNGFWEEQSVWSSIATGAAVSNITAAISPTLSSSSGIGIAAGAYSGLSTATGAAGAVDISKFAQGGPGTSASSGTTVTTTTAANELKIGAYGDSGFNTTLTAGTLDTTYSIWAKTQSSTVTQSAIEDADSGSSGSTARSTVTTGASVADWQQAVVVYKNSAASPPLVVTGTLTPNTSTFNYTSTSATPIAATTYKNVAFIPAGTATYTIASGTFSASGTVTVGNGTNAVTVTAATNNPAMSSTGTFLIASSSIFTSTSGTLTLGGNFTNNGTFNANGGTISLTGAVNHAIAGSTATTFHHMSDIVASSTLTFTNGVIYTWDSGGILTVNGQASGTKVTITSSTTAVWKAHFTSAQSAITFATISHSGCDTGTANVTLDATSTNDATATANESCWSFPITITVSGNIYSDAGSTLLSCASAKTVTLKVNGAGSYSTSCSNTPTNGFYTISGIAVAASNVITAYLDGATEKAVAVTRVATSPAAITLNLYQNYVIVRHEDAGPITNTNLDQYDSGNDADIQFTVTSGALTVTTGSSLYVNTSSTFNPGGNVTIVGGGAIGDGIITASTGTFLVDGTGNFGGNSGTTWTFNNLTFGDGTGTTTTTATGSCAILVNGATTVAVNQTLNAGSKTWNLAGTNPITHVQTIKTADNDNNTTVVSGSFTATAGDLIVASLVTNTTTPTVTSIQLDGSTSFTVDKTYSEATNTNYRLSIASLPNVTAGSHTVTVTMSGATAHAVLYISEFAGAATASPLDRVGGNNTGAGTTAPVTGTFTSQYNNDLYIALVGDNSTSGSSTMTQGSGWTIPSNGSETNGVTNNVSSVEYKIQSNSSSANGTWTTTSSSYAATGVTYKNAGNGASSLYVAGTFTAGSSTVNFTNTASIGIPSLTYNNLAFIPISGSPTYSLSSGTLATNGTMTVGNGANAVAVIDACDITTTTFPITGNPLSECGNWVTGKDDGLVWNDVATSPGLAYGTQLGFVNFDDSLAILGGTWNNDQQATAVVHKANALTGNPTVIEEVELLLRFNISANTATGYEFTYSTRAAGDGNRYLQLNRWNGSFGSFTALWEVPGSGINDGDVLKATAVGTVLTLYVNGSSMFTYDTSTGHDGVGSGGADTIQYSSGHPGIGFYYTNASQIGTYAPGDYGFSSFGATGYSSGASTSTINVTGNMLIAASASFDSTSSGNLSLGANFTNNGTFNASNGTVVLTGAVTHAIAGSSSTTFHNLTDTTDASTITFKNDAGGTTPTYTFDSGGVFTVTGGASKITITSDTQVTNPWLVFFTTAQSSVTNAIISWSGCATSTASVTLDGTSTNSGNNGACWVFPAANILIQGNFYSDDATTVPSVCDSSTLILRARFNGVMYPTSTDIVCTTGTGAFSFTGPAGAPGAGTIAYIWVDGATCGGNNLSNTCATSVVRYSGSSNITGVKLRKNRLVLRSDSGSLTDTDLSGWQNSDDADIVYSAVASTSLTTEDQIKLVVDTGTFTPGGTVVTDASSSSATTDGDLTISSGATLAMASNALTVGGDFTNSGTFTYNGGEVATFTAQATGHTIEDGTANFDTVTFNGSGGGWSLGSNLTTAGAVTITAGNLTVPSALVLSVGGATSISGTLTISSSAGQTFTGDVTINSGGVWNNSGNAAVGLSGSLSHSGSTFTAGSGVYTMSGTTKTIAGTLTIPSLTISGTTTNNGTLTVSTALAGASTLTNGNSATLNVGGATPLSGGTLVASGTSNIVNYTGAGATCKTINYVNLTASGSGTFVCATTTITGNAVLSGTVTWITTSSIALTGTLTVGNGTTLTQGNTFTLTVAGDTTIGGGSSGTFNCNATAGTTTFRANLTLSVGATWTKTNCGTITFAKGSTGQTWTDNTSGQDLGTVAVSANSTNTTLNLGSSVKATSVNINASQTLSLNGSNTLELTGSGTPFTASGPFTPSTGTIKYSGATPTVTNTTYNNLTLACSTSCTMPSSNLTLNGNLLVNGTAVTKAAGIIIFAKPSGGTVTLTDTTGSDLGSVQLTASGGVTTLSLSSSATLTAITIDASQVLTTNANTLTFTAASSIVTGSFTPSSGSTIAYVPSQASGTVTLPSSITYYNLKFNKASNTFTPTSTAITATNNLDVTAGTLDLNTNDPAVTVGATTTIGGTLLASNSGILTLKGDFTNNGTFTHNSGTVVVDFSNISTVNGSITIGGSTTPIAFNVFTVSPGSGKVLKFKSGSTFTFAGAVTLTGLASAPLRLASTTPTSQWIATLSSTSSVNFVTVIDSGCSGGNNWTINDTVFNLGNNGVCWTFVSRGGGTAVGGGGNGGASGGGAGTSGGGNSEGTITGSGGGNPAGTINIDSSSPIRFAGTPADNVDVTSASFTPPAGSLILVLVNADTSASTSITISVSSVPTLTWTKIVQSDYAATSIAGHVSAWYALQPTSQSMTVSARRTTTGGGTNQISAKTYVITGYNTTAAIGASNNGSSTTNNITPTIYTATMDHSVGFAVANDKNFLGLPASTDTYDAANYSNSASVLSTVKGAPTSLSGTAVTMNFDAAGSSTAAWNWVGVEVKPFVASQGGGGGGGGGSP